MANQQPQETTWNGEKLKTTPGQFVTSLKKLEDRCAEDVNVRTIRYTLDKLEKWDFISYETSPEGRLITIVNWSKYQDADFEPPKKPKEPEKQKDLELFNEELIVQYPWPSDEFMKMWEHWKQYKKDEHKFKYKSPRSEQAALNQLVKEVEGDEALAVETIKYSMSNGWKGLFNPNKKNNGKSVKKQDASTTIKSAFSSIDKMYDTNGRL